MRYRLAVVSVLAASACVGVRAPQRRRPRRTSRRVAQNMEGRGHRNPSGPEEHLHAGRRWRQRHDSSRRRRRGDGGLGLARHGGKDSGRGRSSHQEAGSVLDQHECRSRPRGWKRADRDGVRRDARSDCRRRSRWCWRASAKRRRSHDRARECVQSPDGRHQGTATDHGDALPESTFFTPQKDFYSNGEGVQLFFQPKAHSDGDVMVFFRGSDVVSTGDVFRTDGYPVIDSAQGGASRASSML